MPDPEIRSPFYMRHPGWYNCHGSYSLFFQGAAITAKSNQGCRAIRLQWGVQWEAQRNFRLGKWWWLHARGIKRGWKLLERNSMEVYSWENHGTKWWVATYVWLPVGTNPETNGLNWWGTTLKLPRTQFDHLWFCAKWWIPIKLHWFGHS